jgi:hypothetical protein
MSLTFALATPAVKPFQPDVRAASFTFVDQRAASFTLARG